LKHQQDTGYRIPK